MNPQNEATQFLQELRKRVELKTGPSGSPEKTLLDAFKYFDLTGTGVANKKSFVQVMKIRVGITSRSEEELESLFGAIAEGSPTINYRQLISRVFDSKMNLSLKEPPLPPEPSHMSRDKADLVLNEEQIKKTIDYIFYKLRGVKLASFFQLYKEFEAAESGVGELSNGGLSVAIKRIGVDIASEEVQRIFYGLAGDKPFIKTDRLFELFTKNYTPERKKRVAAAYAKFDYMTNGKVSLQLVKELFSPKQTFAAREGRLSPEDVLNQFSELLDGFSKLHGNYFVVDAAKFEQLFSFISAHMKEDKEFFHFVDNCFRYSDLPQSAGSVKNTDKINSAKLDELSIKTSGLDDLVRQLTDQLNSKGNRAYITFYKVLKCNDFDTDGFVFEKEFEKSCGEMRVQFNPKQINRLFEKFAVLRLRLDYHELMNKLVPQFDDARKNMVKEVWEAIALGGAGEILFEQVISNFSARNHPEFRNGHRPDYEILNEFSEGLKAYLNLARGTFLKVNEANLVRFFEFFARNWTPEFLQSVLEFSFRLKGKGSVKTVGLSAPYGTLPEDYSSQKRQQPKSVREEKSIVAAPAQPSKLYEEFKHKESGHPQADQAGNDAFKKKPVEYKLSAPFFTENKENDKQKQSNIDIGRSNGTDLSNVRTEANGQRQISNKNDEKREIPNNRPLKQDSRPEIILESQVESKDMPIPAFDKPAESNISVQQSKQAPSVNRDAPSVKSKMYVPTPESVQEKFIKTLRFVGKIPLILQLEYELTEKSDDKGFVDFEVFVSVLENHDLLKGMSQEEAQMLFQLATVQPGKLHVQNFANKIRGQMSQAREREMINIFDRISGGSAEVPMFVLKTVFLPQKFRFHIYKTMTEARDMFLALLALFDKLNLAVKDKDTFSLDDFLYLADNFSFFISAEDEFLRLMANSFK